jgi:F-type H+-transporting ATPase subunit alpha
MTVADQSLVLFAVTRKYLMEFEVDQVKLYEKKFVEFISTKHPELREEILGKDGLTKELEAKLRAVCDEFRDEFKRILEEE